MHCLPQALSALPSTRPVCTAFHTPCLICLPHALSKQPSHALSALLPHDLSALPSTTPCLHCLPHAPVCTAFRLSELPFILPVCTSCLPALTFTVLAHFLSALSRARCFSARCYSCLSLFTRFVCTFFLNYFLLLLPDNFDGPCLHLWVVTVNCT
jgi:hypothetical protein